MPHPSSIISWSFNIKEISVFVLFQISEYKQDEVRVVASMWQECLFSVLNTILISFWNLWKLTFDVLILFIYPFIYLFANLKIQNFIRLSN